MSDFLTNLIARSFTATPAIQPRVPALFESAAAPMEPISVDAAAGAGGFPAAVPQVAAGESVAIGSTAAPRLYAPSRAAAGVEAPPPNELGGPTPRQDSLAPAVPVSAPRDRPSRDASALPLPGSARPAAPPAPAAPQMPRLSAISISAVSASAKHPRASQAGEPRRAAAGPTIQVTIGRVDVRAVQSPPHAPKAARRATPQLSLDEYLHSRPGGAR